MVGSSAYAAAYQAERLAECVRSRAQDNQYKILAHSRGIKSVTEVSDQLTDEGYLRSVVGLTPIGIVRGGLESAQIARRLMCEIAGGLHEFSDRSRLATTIEVAGRIALHAVAHPFKFVHEIDELLGDDITEKVAALSNKLDVSMIVGLKDKVAPSEEVYQALATTDYKGDVIEIDSSHLSAFTDPTHNYDIVETLNRF